MPAVIRAFCAATLFLLLLPGAGAFAQGGAPPDDKAAVGNARIVDTDILEVGGQRFYLFGIDAPEQEQNCFLNGKPWSCGAVAYREMEKILFEEGGQVACTPRDAVDPKRPSARFGTCVINGKDIADLLVRRGMAVAQPAQSKDYVEAEKAADRAGVGVWQGPFILPWEYRERPR
jgi:endonuclease YncB( thermonuclease family)